MKNFSSANSNGFHRKKEFERSLKREKIKLRKSSSGKGPFFPQTRKNFAQNPLNSKENFHVIKSTPKNGKVVPSLLFCTRLTQILKTHKICPSQSEKSDCEFAQADFVVKGNTEWQH